MNERHSEKFRSSLAGKRALTYLVLVAAIGFAATVSVVGSETEKPASVTADRQLPRGKQTILGLYVTAAQAYEKWKAAPDRVKVIDVRTPEEYAFIGHPEMAWNIPLANFEHESTVGALFFPCESGKGQRHSVSGEQSGNRGFSPERVVMLNLLPSHMAMALDNAGLYSDLEERIAKRTAELTTSNRELRDAKEKAEKTNQAKSEFLATPFGMHGHAHAGHGRV